MRHHQIRGWRAAPTDHTIARPPGVGSAVPPPLRLPAAQQGAGSDRPTELRDLVAWLRQRLAGEHTVRACVLLVEPVANGDVLLLLGEADHPSGSHDPPRIKARLPAAQLNEMQAARGDGFDPSRLVDRTVVLSLRTDLRRQFGRGAGVQARVVALLSVGEIPVEAVLDRETTLRRLRAERRPFGPDTWTASEDPQQIALIASEAGDARHDVEHQLRALEDAGLLRVHRVWARFEGPGAERSLVEALTQAAALHAEHGLAATLLVRGGGPPEAFAPLNAYAVALAATAVPNLCVGLGHAGTTRTAVDEVAARCEPTPTAAAALVREVVQLTGSRAERALAALDAAIERELETAGRIALARAVCAFEAALRALLASAEDRMRRIDREVEHGLLAIAAPHVALRLSSASDIAWPDPELPAEEVEDAILAESLALVVAADTGVILSAAAEARAAARILIQFPDGAVSARIEQMTFHRH